MTRTSIVAIAGTSLALILIGVVVSTRQNPIAPSAAGGAVQPVPLFPGLSAAPQGVERIVVSRGELRTQVERSGEAWVVESKHRYPADMASVREMITGALDAKQVEEKTRVAANFAKLGVAGPSPVAASPDATTEPSTPAPNVTTRLTLEGAPDAAGKRGVLADLLIGRADVAGAPGAGPSASTPRMFVRRVGEDRALLAEARLNADPDWRGWVSTAISRLDETQIDRVEITPPSGAPLVIARGSEPASLQVQNVPEGRGVADEFAAARLASVVSTLNFDDVAPAGTIQMPPEATHVARFTRRDGLTMTVRTFKNSAGEFWIRAQASFTPGPGTEAAAGEAAPGKAEAATLTAQWAPWDFRVAKFRGEDLTRSLESLLAPIAPAPAPATPTSPEPAAPPGG